MRPYIIWILTKKELKSYFDSLLAYIFVILFIGFCGFFTWIYGSNIFFIGQVDLSVFFNVGIYWSFMVLIPVLTMRTLAEEENSGTIEYILTKPVNEIELVISKYLGVLLAVCIILLPTLIYTVTLYYLGEPDKAHIICGYLAAILLTSLYASIGVFASSITKNQIIAFIVAIFIIVILQIILPVLATGTLGLMGEIISYLGVDLHYTSLTKGVIDTRDIVYFISLTIVFLLGAEYMLIRRNIKG